MAKTTLEVIVDALQRENVKIIETYKKPTCYGESREIIVAPTDGLYTPEKLEEFRRKLIRDLPIKGAPFTRMDSRIILGNLNYIEKEVPVEEIENAILSSKTGMRDICIRIYADERMARDLKQKVRLSISPRTLLFYKFKLYRVVPSLNRALDYVLQR